MKCDYTLQKISTPTTPIPLTKSSKPSVLDPKKKLGPKLYLILGLIGLTPVLFLFSMELSLFMILISIVVITVILKNHHDENKKRSLFAAFQHFKVSSFDSMTGIEFENTLKLIFEGLDYTVSTTQTSGDFGVDLILKRNGKTIGLQAKRYKSKVSLDAVQEITSGIMHYNLSEAWVVTNNYFTKPAMKLAQSTNVQLIDRDGLTQCVKDAYQNMCKKNY